jgi:hypothetical protein
VRLVLLHSPLTGPAIWQNLAALLQARGSDVLVPDYRSALSGPPPYCEKITQGIASQMGRASVLIVAHSGAGALIPSLADRADEKAARVVFVDALLPHPGKCWFDTVPVPLAARLRSMAVDGRLPPWNRWWPDGILERMLPDAATREMFAAALPSLPLGYFEEGAPAISFAKNVSCAYLQLSAGYDVEAREAENLGWHTHRLRLNHLAPLTHPDAVINGIERLSKSLS